MESFQTASWTLCKPWTFHLSTYFLQTHYSLVSPHLIDADKDHLQVSIEKLHPKQVENEVEIRGPPVSKAFDKAGNPTKVE